MHVRRLQGLLAELAPLVKLVTPRNALVHALNEALAFEYRSVIMFTTYIALLGGVERHMLKGIVEVELRDDLRHASFLADKVAAMGARPATRAPSIPIRDTTQGLLAAIITAQEEAIDRYTTLAQLAEDYGDLGLANQLHRIIGDETINKEETARLMSGLCA